MAGPPEASETPFSEAGDDSTSKSGGSKGLSKIDFVMRIIAAVGTLGSALAMVTTNQSLSFFTQFVSFRARYNDLPTFSFFVVANVIVCAYLVISLVLSIFHIFKSGVRVTRAILITFDTAMLALLTGAASAAAAIVDLAHKGNARANWVAICRQYDSFCERISGSLVGSFIGDLLLLLLIIMSAVAISRS